MTTPRYHSGCSAGSQVRGVSPYAGNSDNAWIVNFNNGNSNWNNHDNHNNVRACRPSEYPGAVSFRAIHDAYREARRNKVPSRNQTEFETRWLDNLFALRSELSSCSWTPAPSTCFITTRPKAREIHAPNFRDRVVHHWLIQQLDPLYEPIFVHDSFANRVGKGSHAAVRRLRDFVRQVHSGQGGGWYLQLDIKNFFNSIDRRVLWSLLKRRIARLPIETQRAAHALLRTPPLSQGVIYRATAAERALVPAHKRLENAAPGCGLPIGNLSSQFFANVYLNELDQFAKHVLKAKRYLRYVDDFVLVHESREQLATWQAQIETFLRERLHLELKADIKLRPLSAGIDFLGYIVLPTHMRVRRRVVSHAREKLRAWAATHVGHDLTATPAGFRQIATTWASYEGHFVHADSFRLRQQLHQQFPWLRAATVKRRFHHSLEGREIAVNF